MNISKNEQRVLHALAQGGLIKVIKDDKNRILEADCITRDGWFLTACTLDVFKKLRKRRLIRSRGGQPYRITREGLLSVCAELSQR
ncbi:YjhX family toxin [Thalassospira australica]|uniref:YjhX family toxin n=1 Tax=Thalassospira australica TaxID=1528106 RepID=UPI000519FC69|nr:YjhX family toxin [Thalassospira australica]